MSKPITSVAALMLIEQGRFALEDPIAKVAPEFSEMRVLRSPFPPSTTPSRPNNRTPSPTCSPTAPA
jgi:CubicO group peptidase (beta-lactamase class C family)